MGASASERYGGSRRVTTSAHTLAALETTLLHRLLHLLGNLLCWRRRGHRWWLCDCHLSELLLDALLLRRPHQLIHPIRLWYPHRLVLRLPHLL